MKQSAIFVKLNSELLFGDLRDLDSGCLFWIVLASVLDVSDSGLAAWSVRDFSVLHCSADIVWFTCVYFNLAHSFVL